MNSKKIPRTKNNEKARLQDLGQYSIVDSLPESEYNEITRIASYICQTPVALLTIIDKSRQWTKSARGIEMPDIPREYAFCSSAIDSGEDIFVIPDLREDDRFKTNPFVIGDPSAVFYAGVPLVTPAGYALGTLCVLDMKPSQLSEDQVQSLKALANQVMSLLELRKSRMMLERVVTDLEEKNVELDKFSYLVAHDIKSPLNSIYGFSQYLIKNHSDELSPAVKEIIGLLGGSAERLKTFVEGILAHSRSEKYLYDNDAELDIAAFLKDTIGFFSFHQDCTITISCEAAIISINQTALSQILINLISNAIKYNDKAASAIDISFAQSADQYVITVKDNGPGIAAEDQVSVFELFKILSEADKFGVRGNGIGLATVKKIVTKLGGTITLTSEPGMGATFTIMLPVA